MATTAARTDSRRTLRFLGCPTRADDGAISADGGKSWSWRRNLDEGEATA